MFLKKKEKKKSLPEGVTPAILKSICTGEETFGYLDKDNHFVSLELIKDRGETFSNYGVKREDVKEFY